VFETTGLKNSRQFLTIQGCHKQPWWLATLHASH